MRCPVCNTEIKVNSSDVALPNFNEMKLNMESIKIMQDYIDLAEKYKLLSDDYTKLVDKYTSLITQTVKDLDELQKMLPKSNRNI